MATFTELVVDELARAQKACHPIRTQHEGIAVLEEAFLKARGEVFQRELHAKKLLGELVQVAAMAQRVAEDLGFCLPPIVPPPDRDLVRTLLSARALLNDAIVLASEEKEPYGRT